MDDSKKTKVGRRNFIKGAVGGAAVLIAQNTPAQQSNPGSDRVQSQTSEETSTAGGVGQAGRPASDFMVDILKSLEFEYVTLNPGASFQH